MKPTCLLITLDPQWFVDFVAGISKYRYYQLEPKTLGLDSIPHPYPFAIADTADFAIVDVSFLQWYSTNYGSEKITPMLRTIRGLTRWKVLIGLDAKDWFSLSVPPDFLTEFDLILKPGGLFRDPDLYNYRLGALYWHTRWTEKLPELRLPTPYPAEVLEKLRPSVPCMVFSNPLIRRKARMLKPAIPLYSKLMRNIGDQVSELEKKLLFNTRQKPNHFLHFIGGLTHIQRLAILRQLKQYGKFSGTYYLTQKLPPRIWGTAQHLRAVWPDADLAALAQEIQQDGLFGPRLNRNQFKRSFLDSLVALAITGYGELTFRHSEALEWKRLLVCQDLSHVEMTFPLEHGKHCLMYKTDGSDLISLLEAIQAGEYPVDEIRANGQQHWLDWIRHPLRLYRKYGSDLIDPLLPKP